MVESNRRQFLGLAAGAAAALVVPAADAQQPRTREENPEVTRIVRPIGPAPILIQLPAIDRDMVSLHSIRGIPGQEQVSWLTLGNLPNGDEGGLAGGSLPVTFGKVGALIEGDASTVYSNLARTTGTVTRPVYALDIAAGSQHNNVVLYTFQRMDVIASDSVTTTVTKKNAVTLSDLAGGKDAQISFVKNPGQSLFTISSGENANTVLFSAASQQVLRTYYGLASQQQGSSFGPDQTILTADRNGNYSITTGTGQQSIFYAYSADSATGQKGFGGYDGGGTGYLLNNTVPLIVPADGTAIESDARSASAFASRSIKSPRGYVLDLSRR